MTGYEPSLAKDLVTSENDRRFDDFQSLSDKHHMTIGIGVPTISDSGIRISMIVFQPCKPRQTYSKQKFLYRECSEVSKRDKQSMEPLSAYGKQAFHDGSDGQLYWAL